MGTAAAVDIKLRVVGADVANGTLDQLDRRARQVATTTAESMQSAEAMSHSAIFGVGELARGLSRIASSGEAGALAMREVSGGLTRLTAGLGGVGGLIGVFAILGGLIAETFMNARKEIEDTRKKFEEELAKMANSSDSTGLQKKLREQAFGTPFDDKNKLVASSKYATGAFEGSLADLEAHFTALQAKLPRGASMAPHEIAKEYNDVSKALGKAREEFAKTREAALNVASQPAEIGGGQLGAMKILGVSDKAQAKAEKEQRALIDSVMSMIAKSGTSVIAGTSGDAREEAVNRQKKLFDLLKKNNPAVDLSGNRKASEDAQSGLAGIRVKAATLMKSQADIVAEESAKQLTNLADKISGQFAETLSGALEAGIRNGFSAHSIGAGFAAGGKAILSGLGAIFVSVGEQALAGMAFMSAIKKAIIKFSPEVGIAAALGLIALGTVMEAAGSSGGGGGGGGYGGGGGALPAIINTAYLDPSAAAPPRGATVTPSQSQQNYFYVIGPDDPKAGRQIQQLLDNNGRRG